MGCNLNVKARTYKNFIKKQGKDFCRLEKGKKIR